MPERVLNLSKQVSSIATARVEEIRKVTRMTRILGVNASIEASRANNPGFGIVAEEVSSISARIEQLAETLHGELEEKTGELETLGRQLVANIRGSRLADLALNMIDIIDRNLYERSCDVRWWATDAAVVDCAASKTPEVCDLAASRLGVILDAYTVYLDIWAASTDGTVLANGRPDRYAVRGLNVAKQEWFARALRTRSGSEFVACDIQNVTELDNSAVAAYSTAIREGGNAGGRAIGVLGIFFDWQKQSQTVVDSVRLSKEERAGTRCMIIDADNRIIASSDRRDLNSVFPLKTATQSMGSFVDSSGNLVGFALTPGYETYKGLGWYGVIAQRGHS